MLQRCKICHLKGIGTTLILCDDCNLGYHLQCLRPALSDVPVGHWSCVACKVMSLVRHYSLGEMPMYITESGCPVDALFNSDISKNTF